MSAERVTDITTVTQIFRYGKDINPNPTTLSPSDGLPEKSDPLVRRLAKDLYNETMPAALNMGIGAFNEAAQISCLSEFITPPVIKTFIRIPDISTLVACRATRRQ